LTFNLALPCWQHRPIILHIPCSSQTKQVLHLPTSYHPLLLNPLSYPQNGIRALPISRTIPTLSLRRFSITPGSNLLNPVLAYPSWITACHLWAR
jgi:hypothetical protein